MMHRRSFLLGLGALMAAPAIVKATSLMPVKQMVVPVRERMIKAYLDDRHKVVHWVMADGKLRVMADGKLTDYVAWDNPNCYLDNKGKVELDKAIDYHNHIDELVENKLAQYVEYVNFPNNVELPPAYIDNMVLEPFKLPSIQSGESLKDLKYNKELWGNGSQNELVYRGLI
jgi:hypothetical protein